MRSADLTIAAAVLCLVLGSLPLQAGVTPASGTTSDQLVTQQGETVLTEYGDYIAATTGNGGLNEIYNWYIEVPSGQQCLVVDIFDADVGTNDVNNDQTNERDRAIGAYDTSADYELFDPDGNSVSTDQFFTSGDNAGPTGADNAWLTLYAGDTSDTFLDQFGSVAYSNDDGTVSWAADWSEFSDDGSASTGDVLVTGGQLSVRNAGSGPAVPRGVTREADLEAEGACAAVLTFDVDSAGDLEASDCADVSVSGDGGTSWTVLDTFCNDIGAAISAMYDITSFIADDTQVRFQATTFLGGGGEAFVFDDIQIEVTNGAPDAGHWNLQVDMTAGTNGNDVNAYGLRAHDGDTTSGGTEYNVYAESFVIIGINDNASDRDYTYYPYITADCNGDHNDFDFDANNGAGSGTAPFGSWDLTSRSGSFTDSSATMSNNDAWLSDNFSGWTTDGDSDDYGIWTDELNIEDYGPGNYGVVYITDSAATGPAPTAQPVTGSFRLYLPTDNNAAPLKPYVEQFVRHKSGANPPTSSTTSRVTVTVRITNPTPHAITFSSTNLVTARVPGGAVVYAGNPQTSQGTVTGAPSIGLSGDVDWNPGAVAAAGVNPTVALLSYDVDVVNPAGRVPVTGTPSANGTTATYVDETGDTTASAKATFTFGPLCELAVTASLNTHTVVTSFEVFEDSGEVIAEWQTASEAGTLGFYLYRLNHRTGKWRQVHDDLLVGLLHSPQGGTYRLRDPEAPSGRTLTYALIEMEFDGGRNLVGTYTRDVSREAPLELELQGTDFARRERPRNLPLPELPSVTSDVRSDASMAQRDRPSHGALKITVSEDGVYRLSADQIASAFGIPSGAVRSLIKGYRLALTQRGRAIAWQTEADGNGLLFYGQAVDSQYSDASVYWLSNGRGTSVAKAEVSPTPPATENQSFHDTMHVEVDAFAATVLPLDPASDYWFWQFVTSGHPTYGARSFDLPAADVAGSGPATLTVNLQGATETGVYGEHHVEVLLNGVWLGETRWTGINRHSASFSLDGSLLSAANSIEVLGLLDTGAPYSIFYVDSFDLSYQRLYRANGNVLAFQGDGNAAVSVTSFDDPGIVLLELGDPTQPRRVTGYTVDSPDGSQYRLSFAPSSATAPYLAFTNGQVRTPDTVTFAVSRDLASRYQRADHLIIAPSGLVAEAQTLASYRSRRGLSSVVVSLDEIYNEFNHGFEDPSAIRTFLEYAHRYWWTSPRYVVLIGAGTYDFKNRMGYGGNLNPPMMVRTEDGLFASDNSLVDFDRNHIPDLPIGRITVQNATQLRDYVDKLMTYEAGGTAVGNRVVLVADNTDRGVDFGADSDDFAALLPDGFASDRIYLSETPLATARQRLLDAFGTGSAMINYTGHGALDRLSVALFTAADAAQLTNADRPAVVTALTCTANRFEVPGFTALGEELVRNGAGGAVAVWSPTGLSNHMRAIGLGSQLFEDLAAAVASPYGQSPALGDLVVRALTDISGEIGLGSMLEVYTLLGDPALVLAID